MCEDIIAWFDTVQTAIWLRSTIDAPEEHHLRIRSNRPGFDVNNSSGLAIEFKCGDVHVDKCERDLWKLAAIIDPSRYARVFCALIATWPTTISEDPRIERVEKGPVPVNRLTKELDFFSTFHTAFKNQVCCLIGIWEIDAGFYKPSGSRRAEE